MELEELFRSKLENSEIIPGERAGVDLMRKLVRKEFLRFNPLRFNIYYLGGLVGAAATAAIILGTLRYPATSGEIKPVLPGKEKVILTNPGESAGIRTGRENTSSQTPPEEKKVLKPAGTMVSSASSQKAGNYSTATNRSENVSGNRSDTIIKTGAKIKNLAPENNTGYQLQKKARASFDGSVSSGCLPLKVKFFNRSADWDSCRWVFGDGGNSTEKDPEWLFDIAGEYKVILRVYGPGGSESYSEQSLIVYPRPKARFNIEPQAPIIPDDHVRFVNSSLDAVKYHWEFGDGLVSEAFEPEHKYSRYSSYNVRLIVWSEHGCSDSLVLADAFARSGCFINFPNAFIPNPDGPSGGNYSTKSDEAAQIFHPVTSGVSEYQLRIFSKIGILIFESNDINTGWDGYNKGQLCEAGVYIWKVRGTYKNGEPFVKMGDITLLKR